jgi:mannosyl-oligosaccharide alpha-1,2-mannosidase
MFALGGRLLSNQTHIDIGAKLARGCAWGYKTFASGLLPEIFKLIPCPSLDICEWDEEAWKSYAYTTGNSGAPLPKGFRHARDPRYILRPEAIESLFILYRITGEEEFRESAWTMFQSIQKATETPFGNAALDDVTVAHGKPTQRDSMESFWFAETLKYLYLIFSPPDLISLDDWVLNTEAHPFRRPGR